MGLGAALVTVDFLVVDLVEELVVVVAVAFNMLSSSKRDSKEGSSMAAEDGVGMDKSLPPIIVVALTLVAVRMASSLFLLLEEDSAVRTFLVLVRSRVTNSVILFESELMYF